MKIVFTFLLSLNLMVSPVLAQAPGAADAYRVTGNGSKGGYDFYMQQILLLSSGIIGSNILISCPLGSMQPSLYAFMAGSLTHIGGEIFAAKEKRHLLDKRRDELEITKESLKKAAGGDLQKEILVLVKADEEDTRDYLKRRRNWSYAVAGVYGLAAAFATIEAIRGAIPVTAGSDQAACSPNPGTSILSNAVVAAFTSGSMIAGNGGGITQYGNMAVTGVSGAAMLLPKLLGPVTAGMNKAVFATYSSGVARAITFTLATGLATGVALGLEDRYDTAKDNIQRIQDVIDSLPDSTTSETLVEDDYTGKDKNKNPRANKKHDVKRLAVVPPPEKHCYSQSKQGMSFSEKSCASPIKLKSPQLNFGMEISTLKIAANLATDMSQAVANGDMGKAEIAAASLSSMAGRIKEIQEKLEKDLNNQLIAQGKKPIDIKSAAKKQLAAMESDFKNLSSSNGIDLAKIDSEAKLPDEKKEVPVVTEIKNESPAVTPKSEEFKFSEGEYDDEDAASAAEKTQTIGEALADYEDTTQDISKKSDVSIFKQVSNRYLLNYTKFFEQRKELISSDSPKE